MKQKKAKSKKKIKLPNHRYVLQWNYTLSNYGKLKWRNHDYFRTKPDAKKHLKKARGNNQGIYRYRIKKRW